MTRASAALFGGILLLMLPACGGGDTLQPGSLTLDSDALDFGVVPIGVTARLPIALSNGGDLDLSIYSISFIEGEAGAWDLERESETDVLAGGDTLQVEVSFSPSREQTYPARVQIRTSDPDAGSRYVSITGEGGPSIADDDNDGYTAADGDCDDDDATRHPGATEICDGQDNNCDGSTPASEGDADYDGYRGCTTPTRGADCDDEDPDVHPDAAEICDDKDSDCDGRAQDHADQDNDGYSICEGDCADGDAQRSPALAEACDGKDNNCNGLVDDQDDDGDGHSRCDASGDCDDGDETRHPLVVVAGSDAEAPDGSPAAPFPTLADAVAAWPGDPACPIFLYDGAHAMALERTGGAPLRVVGQSQGGVTLTPAEEGQAGLALGLGADVSLERLTLTGGANPTDGGFGVVSGGTLRLSAVTIADNTSGGDGGALAVENGVLTLENCTLRANHSADDGGAIALVGSILEDVGSLWTTNDGKRGGALFASTSGVDLSGSTFLQNEAATAGGAAWIGSAPDLRVTGADLWSNQSAGPGGALLLADVQSTGGVVAGNLFQDNTAGGDGGGIAVTGQSARFSVANNTLTANRAGGEAETGRGAGIFVGATLPELDVISNIVAWSRGATGVHREVDGGATSYNVVFNTSSQQEFGGVLAYLDPEVGQPGPPRDGEEENLLVNPAFTLFSPDDDPSNDDLRLRSDSPARDSGPAEAEWQDADGSRNDRGAYGGPSAHP